MPGLFDRTAPECRDFAVMVEELLARRRGEAAQPHRKEALAAAIKSLGFARTAFGIEAPWDDRMARYRQAAEVRSREFESHAGDAIVQDS